MSPFAPEYVARDDRLYFRLHSVIAANVFIRVRLQQPEGPVQNMAFRVFTTGSGFEEFSTFDLAEGYLLGLAIFSDTIAARRGQLFAEAGLLRGGLTNAEVMQVLVADYLTIGSAIGWPGGNITQSIEGAGAVLAIVGTDPAAGAEISATISTDRTWSLQSVRAQLVTSAAVPVRRVHLIVDDGATILLDLAAADTQAASLTRNYNFANDGFQRTAQDNEIYVPIPPLELLFQGWRIRTLTTGLDVADNWGAPQLVVEQWIED